VRGGLETLPKAMEYTPRTSKTDHYSEFRRYRKNKTQKDIAPW
jgi:hypothetical protein